MSAIACAKNVWQGALVWNGYYVKQVDYTGGFGRLFLKINKKCVFVIEIIYK